MLEIREIYKTFNAGTINEKRAMNGVSLTLNDGDFVTVIGGNGAGKSTLLNLVAGVFPVDSGSIAIDGQDVTRLPEHKRAKFIGRVFQDLHRHRRPGCDPPARTQAGQVHRPGVSGPHDGYRRHHAD